MLWEDAKTIIDKLRQYDSVRIEFCYVPHGDVLFIELGSVGTRYHGKIIAEASGDNALEDALNIASEWVDTNA